MVADDLYVNGVLGVNEASDRYPNEFEEGNTKSQDEGVDTCEDAEDVTDDSGVATFSNLRPFTAYQVGEVMQDGWTQTGIRCEMPDRTIYAEDQLFDSVFDPSIVYTSYLGEDSITCEIGNAADVVLELVKENDTPEPTITGDIVTYTLTVRVPETSGISYNTTVVDVPPENFLVDNTTTASALISSPNRPSSQTFVGTGTTYASPGTWNLGTLYPGDVVELTYEAEIQENVSPGTYPDIAYARGGTVPELEQNETVYSNVHLAQADEPFVGTEVTVAQEQGEVLGVQTLARTGTPVIWHYFVIPILLIGLAISLVRREMKGAL